MFRRSYYDRAPDAATRCVCCTWEGTEGDLVPCVLLAEDVVAFDCPVCSATLSMTPLPTVDEVVAAANAGIPLAIFDLKSALEHRDREVEAIASKGASGISGGSRRR